MSSIFGIEVTCILCGLSARFLPGTSPTPFDCPRCGRFKITFECMTNLKSDGKLRPFLSAATREASERGKVLLLQTDNCDALEDEHRWTGVQEKSRRILEWIRNRSSFFSETVPLDSATNYPLFDAVSEDECDALIEELLQSQLISHGRYLPSRDWQLTMEGWKILEPLSRSGIPGRCFVAMAFDAELDDAYFEGIKPAVTEAGYGEPICMKERLTNEDICDVILAEIRKAQFVVADFTKQKGGVYFEAGFAKALGKEVFWTCRQDDFAGLHFDTNHYGHLKWSDPTDLKRQLVARIVAELGIGPFAKARA
jgi:hypothetical protein